MTTRSIYANRNSKIKESGTAAGYQEYLQSDLWKSIRERVLKRDSWTCRICGEKATQAHHTNYTTKTLLGHSIVGIFAICGLCHKFVEFNRDGSKAHLFVEVRKRIMLLAHLKGRKFIWPGKERRECATCKKSTVLANLGDDGVCRRCRTAHIHVPWRNEV